MCALIMQTQYYLQATFGGHRFFFSQALLRSVAAISTKMCMCIYNILCKWALLLQKRQFVEQRSTTQCNDNVQITNVFAGYTGTTPTTCLRWSPFIRLGMTLPWHRWHRLWTAYEGLSVRLDWIGWRNNIRLPTRSIFSSKLAPCQAFWHSVALFEQISWFWRRLFKKYEMVSKWHNWRSCCTPDTH